ncbi:MAG: hypothetical protein ACLFUI_08360, partial [Halanaerobiales bacterium]
MNVETRGINQKKYCMNKENIFIVFAAIILLILSVSVINGSVILASDYYNEDVIHGEYIDTVYAPFEDSVNINIEVTTVALNDAGGTTYYIDYENGDDKNSGSSPTSPWKHSPGDPEATDNPAFVNLQGGDVVTFKGGVIYRGYIAVRANGSEDNPVVFKGDGWGIEKAIIDGSDQFEGNWTQCENQESCNGNPNWEDIYYIDTHDIESAFTPIYENGQFLWFAQDPNQPDPFWYDNINNYYPAPTGTLTRTSLTDRVRFNHSNPDYYNGAYIAVWCNPNVVKVREIRGFDPDSHTIQFDDLGENAIYNNMDSYYSIINHISDLDRKGEYVYNKSKNRLFIWPYSSEPESAVFSVGKRGRGFRLYSSNIVIEGFEIRGFFGDIGEWYEGVAIFRG